MSRSGLVSIAVIAALAILVAILLAARGVDSEPQYATLLPEPLPLPEFSLIGQDGEPFTRDSLRGQASLMFFGFTHCPDICPATLQQLATARKRLAEEAPGAALPEIILISVDPERDTPEVLRRYVSHFGEGVTGVSGEPADIRSLADALGLFFEKSGSGLRYSVSHSTAVLVIDPEAELQAIFSTPHAVDAFVHDLPLLMASQ